VERVVLNALANERGFAAGYLRLQRLLASSSEKPTPTFGCDFARDTRAATAVEAPRKRSGLRWSRSEYTIEVGAIDLNRPRAVRVNRPYLFRWFAQYDHIVDQITHLRIQRLLQKTACCSRISLR
jgi:hypothetical protein